MAGASCRATRGSAGRTATPTLSIHLAGAGCQWKAQTTSPNGPRCPSQNRTDGWPRAERDPSAAPCTRTAQESTQDAFTGVLTGNIHMGFERRALRQVFHDLPLAGLAPNVLPRQAWVADPTRGALVRHELAPVPDRVREQLAPTVKTTWDVTCHRKRSCGPARLVCFSVKRCERPGCPVDQEGGAATREPGRLVCTEAGACGWR